MLYYLAKEFMLNETGKEIEIGVSDEERSKRRAVLDKTKGADLEKKWAQDDREEIERAEQQSGPPVIIEPRCAVCTCTPERRKWIEQQLIKGHGYLTIARHLYTPDDGRSLDSWRKSVEGHAKKEHMPIDRSVLRAELEAEADLLKQDYKEGIKGALTLRGMLNAMVRKAYEDYANGMTTMEPKDLVQMVKLMNEMNTSESSIKTEETEAALRIFVRAIQNVLPKEQQVLIAVESRRLRELDELEFQVETHLAPKQIEAIDGTAEED